MAGADKFCVVHPLLQNEFALVLYIGVDEVT